MENHYRNMMDEVRAPETLRESVMNMTGQERAKKARSTPMRVLTVAACICALLVVGAVAAEIAGVDFVRMLRGTGENSNSFYYSGTGAVIPAEELSPELRALAEQYRDTDFHLEHLGFDSWEEAEDFLGRKVMNNPLLAGSEYSGYGVTCEGKHTEGNCVVGVKIAYGLVWGVYIDTRYNINLEDAGTAGIHVGAFLRVEPNPEGAPLESAINEAEPSPEEAGNESNTDEYIALEPENYQTANGLEAVIFDLPYLEENGNRDWGHYSGFVYPNGIQFEVFSFYSGQEDKEITLSAVKKVLDNFQ